MKNLIDLMYILEPIFYKIVYMSITASVIGTLILIIRKLLKKQISSKWISRIWIIFIISLIIPIQIKSNVSIYNAIPINLEKIEEVSFAKENILEENKGKVQVSANLENNEISPNSNKEETTFNILCFLPLVWIALVLASFIAYVLTYISFEKKIKNKVLEEEKINSILNKCKEKLNIKKNIKLIKQDIVKMPSIFGMFNIRILVSDDVLKLSEKEIEYIFLHELSHYKRKDNILNMIITILRCIYIFNPIIWILLNQVKRDLELSTDEFAMKNENSEIKKEYSRTLVKVSAINSDKFLIQTMCLSDNKKNIERRIDSIKLIDKFKKNYKIISIVSLVMICLIVGSFYTRSSNYMSPKDIVKLYHKAGKYDNVHYVEEWTIYYPNLNETTTTYKEYYFKDNIASIKNLDSSGKIWSIQYINYNTNEGIFISNENRHISIKDISNVEEKNRINKFGNWYSETTSVIDAGVTYTYIGEEKINGREAYKYEIASEDEYIKGKSTKYVDKKRGVILKEVFEDNIKPGIKGSFKDNTSISTHNYSYEFDNVQDEDILRPNLDLYTDYEITNQVYYSPFY